MSTTPLARTLNTGRREWANLPLRKKGLVVVAIPLLALVLSSTLFFQAHNNYAETRGLVREAVDLRSQIQTVETLLVDAETGVRGYLLTGRASFVVPHSKAVKELPAAVARLEAMAAGSPMLTRQAQTVGRLTADRLAVLDELSRMKLAGASISDPIEHLLVEGKALADRLRTELTVMEGEVSRRVELERNRLTTERDRATAAVVGSLLFGLGAGVVAMQLLTSGIVNRSQRLTENAERLSQGMTLMPLPAGTDEIGQLGRRLDDASRLLAARSSELREAQAFLERLIEASPVVIVRADISSEPATINYVSPNVERLLGYEPAELEGTSGAWAGCVHEEDRGRLEELTRLAVSERWSLMEEEHRVLDRNGQVRWFFNLSRIGYETSGAAATMLVYAFDVTERKHAEEAAAAAREEAERSNRAKSEFLSRMSHELRTPLHSILGFAQLLEMGHLTQDQERFVRHVISGGRHLLALINEVLDLSRIESGRLSLSVELVDLDSAVTEAIDLIRPLAAKQEISLAESQPTGLFVMADRQKLKQVLLNLLANAVKYNRVKGQVWIDVERAEEWVRISVRDSGIGIAPEKRSELFSPFSRLGAEGGEIEGTGLGLALCKGLVEAMHGSMGVESEPSVGSVFWLELRSAEEEVTPEEVASAEPSTTGYLDTRRTVLYVEDNRSNIRLVQSILAQRPNVELLVATEGEQGIQQARKHNPDLVVLDLNLPDIHGAEVLRRLRAEPATHDIPVVVLSADATASQSRRLLSEGASSYLTKPIDVKEFLDRVDEELTCLG